MTGRVVQRFVRLMARGWHAVLEWVFPPCCASCGAELANGGGLLCGACFAGLSFVHGPFCDVCALPLSLEEVGERGWLCDECERTPPIWRKGRAAFLYESQARRLIMGLKYGGRSEYAALLAHFMRAAGDDLLKENVIFVPVPVHRWRLWRRGYNQAALIANALKHHTACKVYPNALRRRYKAGSLAHLSRQGRRNQVKNMIDVNPRYTENLRGCSIILVDDILTTGATAEACTKALLENGCISVDILAAARVTRL